MTSLLETIICSENSDLERFIKFFEEQIANKSLPHSKLFDKTKNKVKLIPEEKAEAKKAKKELKGKKNKNQGGAVGSMADLEKMILAKRDNGFNGFLGYMTAKYAQAEKEVEEEDDDMEDEDEEKVTKKNINSKRIKKGAVPAKDSPKKRRKTK